MSGQGGEYIYVKRAAVVAAFAEAIKAASGGSIMYADFPHQVAEEVLQKLEDQR